MALSKQSLLAACQLILLVCAGMCIICSADFKADVAKQHVAVEHGHLRNHVAKSKVGGTMLKKEVSSLCVQLGIEVVTGIKIMGGLEGSISMVTIGQGPTAVHKAGMKMTLSAGLQFNGVLLKIGVYYSGSFEVSGKVCKSSEKILCAIEAVKEFFMGLWTSHVGRAMRANQIATYTTRLAVYSKMIREEMKKKSVAVPTEAATQSALLHDGDQILDIFRGVLQKNADAMKTKIASIKDEAKAVSAWQMVVFMTFREVYYDEKFDLAKDGYDEKWFDFWKAPDCWKIGAKQRFKTLMCVLMAGGLMLEEPSSGWKAMLPFQAYMSGKYAPKISSGTRNTHKSILTVFPELFFEFAADKTQRERLNKAKILDLIAAIKSNKYPDIEFFDTKIYPNKNMLLGRTNDWTYHITRQMIVLDPDKIMKALDDWRTKHIDTCKPTDSEITTSGVFGATFGSSEIGFCTPDTNIFQIQAGWETKFEQKTDCLWYKKGTRDYSLTLTVSLGPIAAFDFVFSRVNGFTGRARLRALFASSLSDSSTSETLQAFDTDAGNGMATACKFLNDNLKIDTYKSIGNLGPIVGEGIKKLWQGLALAATKGENTKHPDANSVKLGRQLAGGRKGGKGQQGDMDWIPTFLLGAAKAMVKDALVKAFPANVQHNNFAGLNLEWNSQDGFKLQFATEETMGASIDIPAVPGVSPGVSLQFWKTGGTTYEYCTKKNVADCE